jgi:hypothetical protein
MATQKPAVLIKKYRYYFIGLLLFIVLVFGLLRLRVVYQDHNPKIDLAYWLAHGSGTSEITYSSSNFSPDTPTPTFRVPGNWAIQYTDSCKANGAFNVLVEDTNGQIDNKLQDIAADEKNPNPSGTLEQFYSGVYKLEIDYDLCTWKVQVWPI